MTAIETERLDYDGLDPESYRRRYLTVPREQYTDAHWRPRVEAAIAKWLHGRLLDLGCGFGNYLPALARVGRPVGVDLSTRWLSAARRSNHGRQLVRADARLLPFADESFDGALSVGLLEYVAPDVVVRELARVVRSGGHAVILAPNRRSAFRGAARALHRLRRQPYPCQEPTCAELLRQFARHQLAVVDARRDDGLIWLPDALDRRIGARLYTAVETLFRPLGRNPWSNLMLFVVARR